MRELDALRAAGANVVRVDLSWSTLELQAKGDRSSSYVAQVDAFMAAAAERGIRVLPTFWSTPCWASSAPAELKQNCDGSWWERGVTRYPPTDARDYAEAAAWALRRWGGYLAGFQVWNEPNQTSFWTSSDPVGDYVRLTAAAYPALKASRADVPIVVGALSLSDGAFTQALYERGIKGTFDAFSVHPYTEARSPYERRTGDARKWSFIDGVPWIREIMLKHGDDKPIWLTEFGYSSCNDTTDKYCQSDAAQATHTTDAWTILADWPYVHAAIQYNLRNKGTDPSDREDNYGLLKRDHTPKPAYTAFRDALTKIAGLPAGSDPVVTEPVVTDPIVIDPPPVDLLPSVQLTSPTEGLVVSRRRRWLPVAATAQDDRGVERVEFWFDGRLVASDAAAPYAHELRLPNRLGTHLVKARAVDTAGNAAEHQVAIVLVG